MKFGIRFQYDGSLDGLGSNNLFDMNAGLPADPLDSYTFSSGTAFVAQATPLATGLLLQSTVNVLVGTGNFRINLEFDTKAQAAGSGFEGSIEQAATLLTQAIHLKNAVTINLLIGANENGIAQGSGAAEALPQNGVLVSYSTVRADLIANTATSDTNFNALPTGSIIQGQSQVIVWSAEQKSLGLLAGNSSVVDGGAYFDSSISTSLLPGVALHELTHALGRAPYGSTVNPQPDIFDMFRFTNVGTILIDDSTPAVSSSYFSVNGGATALADYGVYSDPSDFLNSTAIGSDVASPLTPNDPFDQYYSGSTAQTLTAVDLIQLDVLWFNTGPACFAAGTRIATADGERPVEVLRAGDMVRTSDGRHRAVRWIGFRHLDLTRHLRPEDACPIVIRAGALADRVPARDLWVSPEHAMYLDAGLVPARMLLNGSSIVQDMACRTISYYHIELDTHDILLAEGAPAESYLDTGNRGVFQNARQPAVLHPSFTDGQVGRLGRSCAPFYDQPAIVEPIWRRLAERAVTLGHAIAEAPETTGDPVLTIEVGGRAFKPVSVKGNRYVFVLPASPDELRVVSRATAPATLEPWLPDRRRLGIAVYDITLRTGDMVETLSPDHPSLTDGWWPAERDDSSVWRWTNGDAALPFTVPAPAILELTVRARDVYLVSEPAMTRAA